MSKTQQMSPEAAAKRYHEILNSHGPTAAVEWFNGVKPGKSQRWLDKMESDFIDIARASHEAWRRSPECPAIWRLPAAR